MSSRQQRRSGEKHRKPAAELPKSRRRLFLAITVSFPFLFLLLLEAALRLFQYGPNLDLFTTEIVGGRTYHVMNPDVKARYFSHVEFSPNTSPDYFSVPKEPGTFRIFCLGGSTTVGYPYGYAGSFSAYLRTRLHALFPERKLEIINLGMTATNSFTVNDIAREIFDYEPDLLLVYDGHNEFYGALGIASHESAARSPWITRLYLRCVHVRTFQLLRDAFSLVGRLTAGSSGTDHGTMMERLARGQYISMGSDVYRDGLEAFRSNLTDLRTMCIEHHIPLLLGTQVSNLRDRPPFISIGTDGKVSEGLPEGGPAADPARADLHFLFGRDLAAKNDLRAAEAEFIKARDLDALRFRASSDQNAIIRSMASTDDRICVADHEQALRGAARDSIIGGDLILEHLHPNARGYFLIAKEYARTMRRAGFFAAPADWASRDTISDEFFALASPLTAVDSRAALRRTEILTSGWPFVLHSPSPSGPRRASGIDGIVERLVAGEITWEQAHVEAARTYDARGDVAGAAQEYRAIIGQLPLNVSAYIALAQIFIRHDSLGAAGELLKRSLSIEKTGYACRVLGSMALNQASPADAIGYLRDAVSADSGTPDYPESAYLLSLAYARGGQQPLAISQLQSLVQRYPENAKASALLRALQRPK